jgi:hypothetical protein
MAPGSRATEKLGTLCNPPYSLTTEIAESVSDEALQIAQGAARTEKFCSRAEASSPYTNSSRPVSSRFFSSRFLMRSRRVATMFCLDARSRSREGDAEVERQSWPGATA